MTEKLSRICCSGTGCATGTKTTASRCSAPPHRTTTKTSFTSFPSKRIASDGRPIEVTDTPAGLSESTGIRNSIVQPVMRRDLERAGTEIYALPQYKLTYDENGYCVKKEKCRIPDDIAAKLAEMNK